MSLLTDRHLKGVRFGCFCKQILTMEVFMIMGRVAPNVACITCVCTLLGMSLNFNAVNVIIALLLAKQTSKMF